MFASSGPVNWELARQLAQFLASGGETETNVDPLRRMRLEELVRVAELQVGGSTGLTTSLTGRPLGARAVTRSEWALRTLDDYKELLERLAVALTAAPVEPEVDEPADPMSKLLAGLPQMLGPMLLGMQTGTMVGQLAARSFGAYDLPVPRPASDELLVVLTAVDAFAQEWSLPVDDVVLWVCLHQTVHHAVLGLAHVDERLRTLLLDYASGFEPDPGGLEAQLGDIDPTDMTSIQRALGDPRALLGAMQTEAQAALRPHLQAVVTAIEGYALHVVDAVGTRLIGSYAQLREALHRRLVEETDSDRFVERLLGFELGQSTYDRGLAFVDGVVERAGEDGLARLWQSARTLPTPAEIAAPGLWLARTEYPDEA